MRKKKICAVVEKDDPKGITYYLFCRLPGQKYLTPNGTFSSNIDEATWFEGAHDVVLEAENRGYEIHGDVRVVIVTQRISFFRWFRILHLVGSGYWIQPNGSTIIVRTAAEAFWGFGAKKRAKAFAKKHGYIVVKKYN